VGAKRLDIAICGNRFDLAEIGLTLAHLLGQALGLEERA
jgi:hypothetical protein